jgi:hypothetical protein
MTSILGDFCQFLATNWCFFLENQCFDVIFEKIAAFGAKNADFRRKY